MPPVALNVYDTRREFVPVAGFVIETGLKVVDTISTCVLAGIVKVYAPVVASNVAASALT
jgi:hypothetical protein